MGTLEKLRGSTRTSSECVDIIDNNDHLGHPQTQPGLGP